MILGDPKSGKTSLSYAIEDYNCQSNLIEQYNDFDNTESKFIEIHQFYMNTEFNEPQTQRSQSTLSTKSFIQDLKHTGSNKSIKILSPKKNRQYEELNAFSNNTFNNPESLSSRSETAIKKSVLPITVYDFNGKLSQFGHLT